MAIDGLKMIHIAGYDGDAEEYFEGLGGGGGLSLLTTGPGGGVTAPAITVSPTITPATPMITIVPPGSSLPVAPIETPDLREWIEKAFYESAPLLDTMIGLFQGQAPDAGVEEPGEETTARSLQRSRAFGALVPIVGSLAGAAKLLPAVLKGGAGISILLNMLNEVGKDLEDFIDPLDPGWRLLGIEKALRSALLVKGIDFEGLDTNVSILKEAFLRLGVDVGDGVDANESLIDDIKKVLEEIRDHAAQERPPEEIDVGDLRVIAGKVIEY